MYKYPLLRYCVFMIEPCLLTTNDVSTVPLVRVAIWHDERSFAVKGMLDDGSVPLLRKVYECQVPFGCDNMSVLETCFKEFNIGERSPVAQEYRALQLRSLSVGDVIQIGEVAYRCDSFGWSRYSSL